MTSTHGTLSTIDGRQALHFERVVAHPIEKVWRAITEQDQVKQWFPCAIEGERRLGATLRFVFDDEAGSTFAGEVTEFEPPRLLAYTWGDDLLRWELQTVGEGCRLVFTNVLGGAHGAAKVAAGWHVCLDALAALLDDRPITWTREKDWQPRFEEYTKQFA